MTNFPQLANCLSLEWGMTFWISIICIIIGIILLFFIVIWFFGVRHRAGRDTVTLTHKDSGVKGTVSGMTLPMTILACLVVLGLIGLTGFGIYMIYDQFRTAEFVAIDSPSRSLTLEEVREKFKAYTRVSI